MRIGMIDEKEIVFQSCDMARGMVQDKCSFAKSNPACQIKGFFFLYNKYETRQVPAESLSLALLL